MTTIKAYLSSAELETRYKTAVDPIGKSHFHALWLLSCGYEVDEVAELLSFSPRWVRALLRRYNEGGAEALGDQRSRNGTKPTILTADALAALKERIKTLPDDGGLWTGPKIARWLAKFHGVQAVHDQRGWDALIAIGYPPLRGSLLRFDKDQTLLYTRGSVGFFRTYPGMYVPRPLMLRCQALGQPLQHVAAETLALTKMNWNNTQFDNGLPITIAAARQVGEVLKYVPESQEIAPRYSFYM